jgi:hypothetical protein
MARPSFRDHLADNLASGQLKAVKSGRNTLVIYESLKEYVANLPAPKLRRQQRAVIA